MVKTVADAFAEFPEAVRKELTDVRRLILEIAKEVTDVGEIYETLKWGQPSYVTERPRSGTTVRLGMSKDGRPAILVHCNTTLISEYRDMFGDLFDFEANRALVFRGTANEHRDALIFCIRRALTYHQR